MTFQTDRTTPPYSRAQCRQILRLWTATSTFKFLRLNHDNTKDEQTSKDANVEQRYPKPTDKSNLEEKELKNKISCGPMKIQV